MGKIMHLGTSSSGGGEIIDNLLSTASSLALSANQGRVLNEKNEVVEASVNQNWQGNGYNLIPFPYKESSKTVNGITFTVNSDGSVTANGTASSTAIFTYNWDLSLPIGTYRLSGCPSGGSGSTYKLDVITSPTSANELIDFGNGSQKTLASMVKYEQGRIVIYKGQTVNLTFKPMLVEVDSNGNYPTEYQRYGLGNVELQNTIEGISGGDEWLSSKAYSVNDYVIYQNKLYRCKANTTAGIVPTNTTYWKPISIKELNTNLVANSTPFVFDYQNGVYGYNTDVERGADTFVPFSGTWKESLIGQNNLFRLLSNSESWGACIIPTTNANTLKINVTGITHNPNAKVYLNKNGVEVLSTTINSSGNHTIDVSGSTYARFSIEQTILTTLAFYIVDFE